MDSIHERNLSIRTTEIGENMICIEGNLTDERLCPAFQYSKRQLVDKGVYHHIQVKMTLSLPKLTIESIRAQMPTVPIEHCREIERVVTQLVGIQLARGFSRKVRERIGGVNGCVHMTQLLLAMSAASVQGSYAYYNRVRNNGKPMKPEYDESLLVNSCHVWRESGPFAHQLEEMKKAGQEFTAVPKEIGSTEMPG